jgi:hypothetical protein
MHGMIRQSRTVYNKEKRAEEDIKGQIRIE